MMMLAKPRRVLRGGLLSPLHLFAIHFPSIFACEKTRRGNSLNLSPTSKSREKSHTSSAQTGGLLCQLGIQWPENESLSGAPGSRTATKDKNEE